MLLSCLLGSRRGCGYVLAVRAALGEGRDLVLGRGLVRLVVLLGDQLDGAVLALLDTDGLFRYNQHFSFASHFGIRRWCSPV